MSYRWIDHGLVSKDSIVYTSRQYSAKTLPKVHDPNYNANILFSNKPHLLRALDDHLDTLSGVNVLEGLFGILKLDTACNELLDAEAARSDEINSQLVVAGSVSEAAL